MFIFDFRLWAEEKMIYFTLGDLFDGVFDKPIYSTGEMLSSGISDIHSEIAYVDDIVEFEEFGFLQVKFGEFTADIDGVKVNSTGFYVEDNDGIFIFSKEDEKHFRILGNIHENPKLKDLLFNS